MLSMDGGRIMKYLILNNSTGETHEIKFDNEAQKDNWLAESGWVCLGESESYLPTRHQRMRNKEEFAGWGS